MQELLGRGVRGCRFAVTDPRMNSKAEPPLAGYGIVLGTFVAALGSVAALERRLDRPGRTATALDLAVLSAATFKSARVVSRERVGSLVRQPFVEERDGSPARPVGDGLQRALGELVTCTRCAGTWAAAGLLASNVVAPRFGRLLTWSLAAAGANDFLQAGFAALCEQASARDRAESGDVVST